VTRPNKQKQVTNLSEEYDRSSVLDFTVEVPIETELIQLKEELLRVRKQHSVDIAVQAENLLRRQKRMVVMDMNYTLIQRFRSFSFSIESTSHIGYSLLQ